MGLNTCSKVVGKGKPSGIDLVWNILTCGFEHVFEHYKKQTGIQLMFIGSNRIGEIDYNHMALS